MRLTILTIDELNTQLLIDLEKLFQDEGYDQARLSQAFADRDDNCSWWVARFNDRHLAAAKVIQQADSATIAALKVRDFTRRRGIGRFLLHQLEAWASKAGLKSLIIDGNLAAPENRPALAQFLVACGYQEGADKQFAKNL